MKKIILNLLLITTISGIAQNGIIKGKVFNAINNEAIPFALIGITSISAATFSDAEGNY